MLLCQVSSAKSSLRGTNNLFLEPDQPSKLSQKDNPYKPQNPHNHPKSNTRIIGGQEATPNQYPFAVSLQDWGGHFCGGSLITKNIVLTAAHCQGTPYSVVLGRHNVKGSGGQTISAKKEIPHTGYDDETTDNDFMLVVLSSDATINNDVKLVSINRDSAKPNVGGGVLTAMGWGDTSPNRALSNVLMEVNVNTMSNSDCDKSSDGNDSYQGKITDNMLCARASNKDSCQGDSGGPLMAGNTQVGVVSWGIGCADPSFPGLYARVSQAQSWIEREVCMENREHATDAGFDCSNISESALSPASPTPPTPSGPNPSPGGSSPSYQDEDSWGFVYSDDWSPSYGDDAKGDDYAGLGTMTHDDYQYSGGDYGDDDYWLDDDFSGYDDDIVDDNFSGYDDDIVDDGFSGYDDDNW